MYSLADRLKLARETKGLSQQQLADRVGVSQSTIGNLEAGTRQSARKLPQIADALGVNALWLSEGRGPMALTTDAINVRPVEIGLRKIPLISSVQAGLMTEALEPFPAGSAFEYLLTDLPLSEHAFALEIEGQSMEPEFKEGDRIIVDPALQPQPGDFVVAKNGREEATFKKYRPRGIGQSGREVFELVPLNDDYPTINSEHEPARIIGVMVEHRRYRRR